MAVKITDLCMSSNDKAENFIIEETKKPRIRGMNLPIQSFVIINNVSDYPKNPNRIPAATAEPITPATFGPMACISR